MATEYFHKNGPVGGHLNPVTITKLITFSSGAATVTAASLGLATVLDFQPSYFGVTTGHLASCVCTNDYVEDGLTSLSLEYSEAQADDGSGSTDLDKTIPITFTGIV